MKFFRKEINELDCSPLGAWTMGFDAYLRGETDVSPFKFEDLKKEWTEGYFDARSEYGNSGWGQDKKAISCPHCGGDLSHNKTAKFYFCPSKTCVFSVEESELMPNFP